MAPLRLRALVTGATGFVGSRLVLRLAAAVAASSDAATRGGNDVVDDGNDASCAPRGAAAAAAAPTEVRWERVVALRRRRTPVPAELATAVAAIGDGKTVQWAVADVLDPESLAAALTTPDAGDASGGGDDDDDGNWRWVVFHLASDNSMWRAELDRQFDVNVRGTENIVALCTAMGERLHRLVYTSTQQVFHLGALLGRPGHVTRESDPYLPLAVVRSKQSDPAATYASCGCCWFSGYQRSKLLGERAVLAARDSGKLVDPVILYPSHVVGAGDTTSWAQVVRRIAAGSLPGVGVGGGCFASVDAVVDAHVRAATADVSQPDLGGDDAAAEGEDSAAAAAAAAGEQQPQQRQQQRQQQEASNRDMRGRYLLGGPFHTWLEFAVLADGELTRQWRDPGGNSEAAAGVAPKQLPAWLLRSVGTMGDAASRCTGRKPAVTPETAVLLSRQIRVSSERAERDLDYTMRPLAQSVASCVRWLSDNDHLGPPPGKKVA